MISLSPSSLSMSDSTSATPFVSPIKLSHGPPFIGIFVNTALFGITILQTWNYYICYKKDPKWIKCFVGLLMLEDTLNTIFSIMWIYDVLILNFGNLPPLMYANWMIETDPGLGSIIAFTCQAFFIWRVYALTQNWLMTSIISFTSVVGLVGGLLCAIMTGKNPDMTNLKVMTPYQYLWFIPAVVTDILISLTMVFFIRRKRTGFSKTEDILNRILRFSIQSCLLTTLIVLATLVAFVTAPTVSVHLCLSLILPKLYSNSVLSSLNSRRRSATAGTNWEVTTDEASTGISLSKLRDQPDQHLSQHSRPGNPVDSRQAGAEVYVDVQMHISRDDDLRKNGWVHDDEESLPSVGKISRD
ncbi:hypothetical protein PNOK_0115300 [Pyrrhoderma noxium]|uniref:DUF6534 domain-containing protein n=1 Tax=Pyrrhoderma noxium TaxID=2282107 RepID=A0A286UX98_9AGAM|nr:hypothetical protein PNOK_0115300 [Pyrrhoderma noxium]